LIAQYLRHLDKQQLTWSRQLKRWQEQGALIISCTPPAQSQLLLFRTDSGWEGMVDLYEWISHVMPERAELAPQAFSADQLETLFIHSARPFESSLEALDYQKIVSHGRVNEESFTRQARPALCTEQGKIWLMKPTKAIKALKAVPATTRNLDLGYLPLSLHFTLGYAQLSLAAVRKIHCGDVLLISHHEYFVTTGGKKIGLYRQTEEQMMIEEYQEDEFYSENDMDDVVHEVMDDKVTQVPRLSSRDKLPVRLTFTLEQRNVTVAELEQLYQGACLSCTPNAQKNVIIRANGIPLAKGELVWIDDRMGVEITAICNEAGNGK